MERPTKYEVALALMVARPGAAIGPNVACVLAAEVRALLDGAEKLAAKWNHETNGRGWGAVGAECAAELRTLLRGEP